MKCPSCGNFAKSEFNVFFGLSILKFKCQFCNEVIRGNLVMIFLDFLSIAVYVVFALWLKTHAVKLYPLFGEITFPLLGAIGIFAIRLPFVWLMMKLGRFVSVF